METNKQKETKPKRDVVDLGTWISQIAANYQSRALITLRVIGDKCELIACSRIQDMEGLSSKTAEPHNAQHDARSYLG